MMSEQLAADDTNKIVSSPIDLEAEIESPAKGTSYGFADRREGFKYPPEDTLARQETHGSFVQTVASLPQPPEDAIQKISRIQGFIGQDAVFDKKRADIYRRRRDWNVWPIYNKEASQQDEILMKSWDDDMDVLLIFAALFSAVVTAFLAQNSSNLSDAVNCLWFAALMVSISAALLAMLGKTWIRQFSAGLSFIPYDRARQRQFRWNGARRWKLGAVFNTLTLMLHTSVFLFFGGLLAYLSHGDRTVFICTTVLASVAVFSYLTALLLPIFFPDAPFRIPLLEFLRSLRLSRTRASVGDRTRARELKYIDEMKGVVDAQAVTWLLEMSEAMATKEAFEASTRIFQELMAGTTMERDALFRQGVLAVLYRLFLDADENEDQPRIVQVLNAIRRLWHDSDSKECLKLHSRAGPTDELHTRFFNRLVELLETSDNVKVLAAAIQLPRQFAGWPIAEWPIASRISIPAVMQQLDRGLFQSSASIQAALNVVYRVFCFMRSQADRHVHEQDVVESIPVVSRILLLDDSPAIIRCALDVVDELDGVLYGKSVPTGWPKLHAGLYVHDQHGLLRALLHVLTNMDRLGEKEQLAVRRLLCRLVRHPEIGEMCRTWVVRSGSVPIIIQDVSSYVAPIPNTRPDHFVLLLIGFMTEGGFFDDHVDAFVQAGFLPGLASYFKNNGPPYDLYTIVGLLRRLIRLAGQGADAQKHLLNESQVLNVMVDRLPERFRPTWDEDWNLVLQVEHFRRLAKSYLVSGSVPPDQIPQRVQPPGMVRLPPA